MEIRNLNPEKGRLELSGGIYYFYYNPLKHLQSSEITLEVEDETIKSFRVSAGCTSCTKVSAKKVEDKINIKISYDTRNLGNFNKSVNFFATREKEQLQKIKIIGMVNS
jgi:hypothetical protein